jgi:hypothetical protein
MIKGVGAFFRSLLEGPFGGKGDKNACRPLPIPANHGFAIPVSAGPPFPSDSVKFEGVLLKIFFHFHPAIVTTAGDILSTTDLKLLNKKFVYLALPQ